MVDVRKETQGENSMKGVELFVMAYDSNVHKDKETGEIKNHYLDVRMHPEDRRADKQSNLALVSKTKEYDGKKVYDNKAPYAAKQMDAIKEAAGDNKTPLLTKDGKEIGTIYGVKADLMVGNGRNLLINTKTLESTDKSVQPDAEGKSVLTRSFEKVIPFKEAQEAARAEKAAADKEAKAAEAQAEAPQTETEQVSNDQPDLG